MYSSEDRTVPRRRRTPSFSSSLLDAIYRSIDDSNSEQQQDRKTTTTKKKQTKNDNNNNLRRATMIESWVEKQSASQVSSSSSSSESLWSSSETESRPKPKPKPKPKPEPEPKPSPKPCHGFSKTKLGALKLYGELKKAKQPISPGRRIASFLNSIFSPGGAKKPKMCYVGAVDDVAAAPTSSRPCLVAKPQPSPRAKSGDNNNKRSVRFYPVSVVLGEDSKPCGHKRVCDEDDDNDPCLLASSDMRSFLNSRFDHDHRRRRDDDDDDDDDDESCSSSDLFEIDHLVGVGLRYREELPVYETTSLKANQAIANAFIDLY